VCFSPQADLVGGVAVLTIGIDACRHLRSRRSHLVLAGLPLLLGAHQAVETFVWWGADGTVPHTVARVALWVYLLVAFVVLPIVVPLAILTIEPTRARRARVAPFVALGGAVAIVLLAAMLRGPIGATEHPYHLAYSLRVPASTFVIACYVVAVCTPLLISGFRHVAVFGLVNLVAVVALLALTAGGFASLWCAYAAVTAGAVALHMRIEHPEEGPARYDANLAGPAR
jgi:hypothetical protein